MITSYRFIGDRWANLDPLKRTPRPDVPNSIRPTTAFPTPI
jgi:2-oxoglutarate dehydrogenase complex dehydrogenase (E1) component-like enzyme